MQQYLRTKDNNYRHYKLFQRTIEKYTYGKDEKTKTPHTSTRTTIRTSKKAQVTEDEIKATMKQWRRRRDKNDKKWKPVSTKFLTGSTQKN